MLKVPRTVGVSWNYVYLRSQGEKILVTLILQKHDTYDIAFLIIVYER